MHGRHRRLYIVYESFVLTVIFSDCSYGSVRSVILVSVELHELFPVSRFLLSWFAGLLFATVREEAP